MSLTVLQQRLGQSTDTKGKSENEVLFDEFQELKSLERQVSERLKALRPVIDEKMASGEMVGYPDAHLTLQESTRYEVDQAKAKEAFGPEVWARCAEVTGPKMKDALKLGLITQAEFDSVTTPKVSSSLVTKTDPKALKP